MNRKEMMEFINNTLDDVSDTVLAEVCGFLKFELGV